jgi:hypothetical protein
MKYVCDPCFDLFPSGSISDIPDTLLPTIATFCQICGTLIQQGMEPTGHMVSDCIPALLFPLPPVSGSVSGSL